jgi:hypothetical protein
MIGVADRTAAEPRAAASLPLGSTASSRPDPECPYPGLPPFEEDDSEVFFGREAQTDALLARLRNKLSFVAVVGPSGGGKSSLVRAGLIPALRDGMLGDAGFEWRIVVMRPGAAPANALAEAVVRIAPDLPDDCTTRARREFARTEIMSNASDGLTNAVAHLLLEEQDESEEPLKRSSANVLLVVDQFEELFRLGRRRGDEATWWERSNYFVQQLLCAAEQTNVRIHIVITMRTEFVGHCATFFGLPDALNSGQYLVPRLTQQQLRDAIERPLQQRGQTMSPALVQRILADSTRVRDELPVLQHAIMRTWRAWKRDANAGEIAIEHYESAGPLDDAIGKHAEEIYGDFGDAERRVTEVLFRRVSRKSENVVTRSPVSLRVVAELAGVAEDSPEVCAVVDAFSARGCRMLHTAPKVDRTDVEIDVTHEAVLRLWKRASEWIDDEAKRAATYRAIVDATEQFERGEIGPWRHPQLGGTLDWWRAAPPTPEWAARYHSTREPVDEDTADGDDLAAAKRVLARVQDFLRESEEAADVEVALQLRSRQVPLYRAAFIGALIGIAVVLSALVYAKRQENAAEDLAAKLEDRNTQLEVTHQDLREETARALLAEAAEKKTSKDLATRNRELVIAEAAAAQARDDERKAKDQEKEKTALLDSANRELDKANAAERKANADLRKKYRVLWDKNLGIGQVGADLVVCRERLRTCGGEAAPAGVP